MKANLSFGTNVEQLFLSFMTSHPIFFEGVCVELLPPSSDSELDWLNTLTLVHIVGVVASDQNLIIDPSVWEPATSIVGTLIDSFSKFQWISAAYKVGDGS